MHKGQPPEQNALSTAETALLRQALCAEVHDDELLKELPAQLRTAIVAHLLQGVFDTSHLFAVSCFIVHIAVRNFCACWLLAGCTQSCSSKALACSVWQLQSHRQMLEEHVL